MKLRIGVEAPGFALPDQHGTVHALSDYRGSWTLIYFYPKDDTPGCTKEACALRDDIPQFQKLDTVVLGISPDSVKSHAKFAEKYLLPFTLLADEAKGVVKRYGVWAKKKFMGKEYLGVLRTSFLVSPEGLIVKIYEKVKPETHAGEVLADLEKLR